MTLYIYYFIIFYIRRAILTQTNPKKGLIEKKNLPHFDSGAFLIVCSMWQLGGAGVRVAGGVGRHGAAGALPLEPLRHTRLQPARAAARVDSAGAWILRLFLEYLRKGTKVLPGIPRRGFSGYTCFMLTLTTKSMPMGIIRRMQITF